MVKFLEETKTVDELVEYATNSIKEFKKGNTVRCPYEFIARFYKGQLIFIMESGVNKPSIHDLPIVLALSKYMVERNIDYSKQHIQPILQLYKERGLA